MHVRTCMHVHVRVVGCFLGYVHTSVCSSAVRWKTLDALEEPNTKTVYHSTSKHPLAVAKGLILVAVREFVLVRSGLPFMLTMHALLWHYWCEWHVWAYAYVCTHVLKCICISYVGERACKGSDCIISVCCVCPCTTFLASCVQFESAWTQQTPVSLKYQNLGGGRKPAFERPSRKKRKVE